MDWSIIGESPSCQADFPGQQHTVVLEHWLEGSPAQRCRILARQKMQHHRVSSDRRAG